MWSWQPPSVLINVEQWQILINAIAFWIVMPFYLAWLFYYVAFPLRRYLLEGS